MAGLAKINKHLKSSDLTNRAEFKNWGGGAADSSVAAARPPLVFRFSRARPWSAHGANLEVNDLGSEPRVLPPIVHDLNGDVPLSILRHVEAPLRLPRLFLGGDNVSISNRNVGTTRALCSVDAAITASDFSNGRVLSFDLGKYFRNFILPHLDIQFTRYKW